MIAQCGSARCAIVGLLLVCFVSVATTEAVLAEEKVSGIDVNAITGKTAHVPEGGRVGASAEGLEGDLAFLLCEGSLEDRRKTGWEPPQNSVFDVASSYASTPTATSPRFFDAIVQQIARLRPRRGGEAGYAEGMGGDVACLLYGGLEDRRKTGWEYAVSDVASSYAGTTTATSPRFFDAVVQQMTRWRLRLGGEVRYVTWMMEGQLAQMQIDAVTDDESVMGERRRTFLIMVIRWVSIFVGVN